MKPICSLIFTTLLSFNTFASDVTVYINGGILTQSCNVSSNDLIKNVVFDDLNPKDFTTIGSVSEFQPVTIHLENCTGHVNNMSYQFSGEADELDSTLLKVLGQPNNTRNITASGLAIEIANENKQKINLNTKITLNEIINSKTYDLIFNLRYKSTQKDIGSGDASSLLYLDIYYE
ncbi:fimbrial protein [Providencia burhodogranariea]|uniref:Putative fimbrial minor structural subunit n=1 Tax=Providencia burhodogranariea DSM 19968 TaxID=1141662 RepID=K8W613_9GAMM|nr:fimbrial protein [Providencia burhodogranariea]EKT56048.1 putative fimbrial minor structural subunit [Providencia burhodogranariea DSM 19968]